MKQVHMGGYSISVPENYVHNVKVSRIKGAQDVRCRISEGQHTLATAGSFEEYPCWESDIH